MAQGGIISATIPVDFTSGDLSNALLIDIPCDATVYIGAVVRISAGIVYNALADSVSNSNVIGIVEAKSSSTICTVRVSGITENIFSGLDDTKVYYLSSTVAGLITVTPPSATGEVMIRLGVPYTATSLVIDKGTRVIRA